MLLLLLACVDDPVVAHRPDPVTSATTPITTPSTSSAPSSPTEPVPGIAEALDCEAEPGAVGLPGDALHRVTLTDPVAVCNDGTPAIAYVRAATDPAAADKWVVTLEGGSWCGDWETCRARWCGEDYDAAKMSSQWAPETTGGGGILSRDAQNAFAGWNHVFLYYCSSDLWAGTAGDVVVEGEPSYLVHFRGRDIVLATLDALDAGAVSDDAVEVLPSLRDAEQLVLGGISAGGYGVVVLLDDVAARYPQVAVRGLIDSLFYPDLDRFPTDVADGMRQYVQDLYTRTYLALYDGHLDQSCLADFPDPADHWHCADPGRVQRDHVETPYLLVHDLLDPVLDDEFLDAGATRLTYAEAGEATLRASAAERPEIAVRAAACGEHTHIENDAWFGVATVVDAEAGGSAWTIEQALESFLDAQPVVAIDHPDGANSVCF